MREIVAPAPVRCAARFRLDPDDWRLCPGLASRHAKAGIRDRARLPPLSAEIFSPAASLVAEHRLAQAQSLVRSASFARIARPRRGLAMRLAILLLLAACAPVTLPMGPPVAVPQLTADAMVT